MGEHHPAAAKQVIVAPVARLPLQDAEAIHKFKLLAGVNWSEKPPRDAGIGPEESGEHGYIKISTETFPEQAMNLKWGSDVLDRLIEEANDVRYFSFELLVDRICSCTHPSRRRRIDSKTSL
jgi:small subunit ribosomal protein S35